MDLSPFTRAGLKLKEIGTIVGVSHTTAGLWMRGKRNVHYLLEDNVQTITKVVDDAVHAGELPLSSTIPREERLEKIQRIIADFS